MKKVFQIFLIVAALFLTLLVFRSIMRPEKVKSIYKDRHDVIRDRLITLRTAQTVYRNEFKKFASSIDTLHDFVNNGFITIEKNVGELPEGMTEEQALKDGILKKEITKIPASKKIVELDPNTEPYLKNFNLIPFNKGKKFEIQTGELTSNTYKIPVYRIDVNGEDIMANLDESINPPNTGTFKRFFNFIMYSGLDSDDNTFNNMYMGSLTESSTTGSWE
ncbi:hypothetical protein LJC68_02850 [Bacteroidales bacterium OttesenSCG-928-B11]|nr:hypothetical protein [Bacteroidales bacterium OttesenSCG-928-C03]MDL2311802.1 hypothetical protein [Bacteroidales bacterium OttesenSCG-928-B11]MDL2326193.1 hypothetical protein [Bacteroidales bacterium OttesenSCG-928-A14]